MRKIICCKLKIPFANNGSHRREEYGNTSTTKPNVKEEYKEAFRTKSYIEISDKVESHLMKATTHDVEENLTADSTSSPPPPFPLIHLSPYSSPSTSDFNHFFTNYFEITLEASRICESLLTNINQARKNHLRVKKAIKRISGTDESYHLLHKNLTLFAAQRNPFSSATNPERFLDLRESHVAMFQELTRTCKKLKRRTLTIKLIKKSLASLVLMGFGALVAVALAHCTAGLAVAPALAVLALVAKNMRRLERRCDEKRLEGLAAKLDVAARGVFIMINDFATMRMIVKRLEDEIEHRRFVADVCVRKGRKETLREVVREFQVHESCFVEQLEELERQICLCFLDIDRSKRLLVREMVK
ncbi:UPF0496 protein At1g20180-like [Salvia hispanica]|uniref:UPF0496 protein At1g20180-like n=1 Tax=Salvia hispanica TaxID=49212 RepID=UPI0020090BCF|nr:UPF0496 protein At1g20180-like [Salvia hispanica]